MIRSRLVLALVPVLVVAACSGGAGETSSSGSSGQPSSSSSGVGGASTGTATSVTATGTGGSGGGLDTGCASGVICGNGQCCAKGDECIEDACLPGCASQVRCGPSNAVCCNADELCLGNVCTAAKGPCLDWADCADGEFCEPTLHQCVPEPTGGSSCDFKPVFGPILPKIEWQWTGSPILPTSNQVINMPAVMDLDKDGKPDVVIVTSVGFTETGGYLRALNGVDGTEKWVDPAADVYQMANQVNPRGTPALADLDGDGFMEIVTPKSGGGLIAFNHDGSLRWTSTQADGTTPYTTKTAAGTVDIADLDADGVPEVILGGVVFGVTGQLLADNGVFAGSHQGSNYGAVSVVADLDGDGQQEIVTGRAAFDQKGSHQIWDNGKSDGYPAIADLDGNGTPEIVVISNSTVRVQDATGAVLAELPFPAGISGAGGPPTIADFDGDGKPDFSTAGGNGYMVFKYAPGPPAAITLLWSSKTQDLSSNRTGSSVFDFQGDGAAEVVYGDECFFRIYSGKDGTVLFQTPSSSGTIHEYPVVVDVDGDNQTEIVVVSNDANTGPGTCPLYGPMDAPRHGVFVYGDTNNQWVRTRRIWNQHAYHLTNIGADGAVPHPEPVSWVGPQGLNNYRVSSQGAGVFNAPDLEVSLSASLAGCPGTVELDALVQNHGSLGVAAGVDVSFYAGKDATGMLIATKKTTKALLPGQYELVSAGFPEPPAGAPTSFFVVVDGNAQGMGAVNECLEDNNGAGVDGAACPVVH